jgi:hypothetical protein
MSREGALALMIAIAVVVLAVLAWAWFGRTRRDRASARDVPRTVRRHDEARCPT